MNKELKKEINPWSIVAILVICWVISAFAGIGIFHLLPNNIPWKYAMFYSLLGCAYASGLTTVLVVVLLKKKVSNETR